MVGTVHWYKVTVLFIPINVPLIIISVLVSLYAKAVLQAFMVVSCMKKIALYVKNRNLKTPH